MTYKTILFDLDGTLTDSGSGIINSVSYALEKMGVESIHPTSLTNFIGPPLHESFRYYCDFSPEECEQAVAFFREYFTQKGMFENTLYPGIEECLKALKAANKTLLVATSKPEVFAKQILEHFQLDTYFDVIAGASLNTSRIKKAHVIAYALEKAGLTPGKELVMIGDREHDIKGAASIHLDAIGVLYGYGSKDELEKAGAIYLVTSPLEILEHVR